MYSKFHPSGGENLNLNKNLNYIHLILLFKLKSKDANERIRVLTTFGRKKKKIRKLITGKSTIFI